jgi:hypothetical protein
MRVPSTWRCALFSPQAAAVTFRSGAAGRAEGGLAAVVVSVMLVFIARRALRGDERNTNCDSRTKRQPQHQNYQTNSPAIVQRSRLWARLTDAAGACGKFFPAYKAARRTAS